jgi:CRP/FNR family transcriptional regulator, anaerobic regulatory protein
VQAPSTELSNCCLPSCNPCIARESGLCAGLAPAGQVVDTADPRLRPFSEHIVPARRVILRQRDLQDEIVPFVCQGWAATVVTLSDGSRQILMFLLPGDIVSTSALQVPATLSYLVEAVTEVQYRCFARADVRARLHEHPSLLDKFLKLSVDRKQWLEQLAVDLGRRTAEERIARLIFGLRDRLSTRGMVHGPTMDFPLRQHHVADATGLTAVHVSKVLTEFRRRALIEIQDRSLTILDFDGFRRIATMR